MRVVDAAENPRIKAFLEFSAGLAIVRFAHAICDSSD
jgi:hypothetical protein